MSRTFSLARLMLGVTLFCVVCAVAAYYGKNFGDYLLVASLFLPTAIVCLTLVSFSRRRPTTMVASILGAVAGAFFFMPAIAHTGHQPMSAWEVIWWDYSFLTVFSPLGSLVLGAAALVDEAFICPKSSMD